MSFLVHRWRCAGESRAHSRGEIPFGKRLSSRMNHGWVKKLQIKIKIKKIYKKLGSSRTHRRRGRRSRRPIIWIFIWFLFLVLLPTERDGKAGGSRANWSRVFFLRFLFSQTVSLVKGQREITEPTFISNSSAISAPIARLRRAGPARWNRCFDEDRNVWWKRRMRAHH